MKKKAKIFSELIIIATLISITLFLMNGCGREEVQRLQSEKQAMKNENETLKSKITLLEQEISKLKETAEFHYHQGIDLSKDNKYGEAKAELEAVIEKYPASPLVSSAKQQLEKVNREIKKLDKEKQLVAEKAQALVFAEHSEDINDFIDNTEKFSGKTITILLFVGSHILKDEGHSLRDFVGSNVKFFAYGSKMGFLDIVISIPHSLSVPNAGYSDQMRVTFICREGSLRKGNQAVSIERP